MGNVIRPGPDGINYLVPENTPEEDITKGVPLSVDLTFLDFPVQLEQSLRTALRNRRLVEPRDFERPGTYKLVADALKEVFKVTANEMVDHIRREQL